MSVLLDLPSYLFYQIVNEWIDPTVFLAFTHLDNAVKSNSNLRLMLLSQFTATKELFVKKIRFKGVHFDWSTGYFCNYFEERFDSQVNVSSFVGLHLVITKVCCSSFDANHSKWIECCEMKYLKTGFAKVLQFLSGSFESLETLLIFDFVSNPTSDMCFSLKNCKKLKELHCYSNDKQLLLEVVANNVNTLTELKINGAKGLCDVIANCRRLKKVVLEADKSLLLDDMLKLIAQLPLLTDCNLNGDCQIEWSRKDVSSSECDEINWIFRNKSTLESNMQILLKYFKHSTVSISLLCYGISLMPTIQSVLQQCSSLKCIDSHLDSNFVECFKNVTPSLTNLYTLGTELSLIIKILNYCKSITKALFNKANFLKVDRDEAIAQIRQCIQDRNITVYISGDDWKIELIGNGQPKEDADNM